MLSEMVQEHDEPILKHLFDIKVIFLESNPMVSFGHIVHRHDFGHIVHRYAFGHIVHRYAFTHSTACTTPLHNCDLAKFCDQ